MHGAIMFPTHFDALTWSADLMIVAIVQTLPLLSWSGIAIAE
jgi:hypothetical protein